jgi:hypothetical protein
MSMTDIEYFRGRAHVERALALAASDPRAAAAHRELASGYDLLVRKEERRGQAPRRWREPPELHLVPAHAGRQA